MAEETTIKQSGPPSVDEIAALENVSNVHGQIEGRVSESKLLTLLRLVNN